MYSDDELLDIIAGPIDAPAVWRHQFYIMAIFGCFAVAVFEGDARGSYAYLWVFASGQLNPNWTQEDVPVLTSNEFALELESAIPESIASHWEHWHLAGVEDVLPLSRDGIGLFMRSFDGSKSSQVDLTNPDPNSEPRQWQAREEIFDTLDQLFGWKAILAQSYQDERRRGYEAYLRAKTTKLDE